MNTVTRRDAVLLAFVAIGCSLTGPLARAGAEILPLAIRGYDPVAYFVLGMPARGVPEFELEWDEQRYRFASAEHRAIFKNAPMQYAPQFGNFCAMALSRGELDEANPENWLISEGKLYIFGKAAPMGPSLFQQDLAGNIARSNENRELTLPR
jgi:hypothetical protein